MTRFLPIGGMPIRNTTSHAFLRYLRRRDAASPQVAVGFVNQHFVVACQSLRQSAAAGASGLMLVNDGIGVSLAAKLVHGARFRENMNGTDLVPLVLREAERPLRVFLLGGTREIVDRAALFIGAMPHRTVVGAVDGFSIWDDEAALIRTINAAAPDLLLVGLGNPRQESWILEHRHALRVGLIFAVGALYEWMTGSRRRAPEPIRRLRMEWLYRLALEPRRLGQRYTIDILRFFAIVWRERRTSAITPPPSNRRNA